MNNIKYFTNVEDMVCQTIIPDEPREKDSIYVSHGTLKDFKNTYIENAGFYKPQRKTLTISNQKIYCIYTIENSCSDSWIQGQIIIFISTNHCLRNKVTGLLISIAGYNQEDMDIVNLEKEEILDIIDDIVNEYDM